MKKFAILVWIFLFIGCGYRPISKISDDILGNKIYVDVVISKLDPQNSVFIKDSIRSSVVSILHKELVSKDEADSSIIANIKSLTFTPLVYDTLGYVTIYHANLIIEYTTRFKNGEIWTTNGSGEYDFRISSRRGNLRISDSIISDTDRFNAINNASIEAFNEYISKLAIKGYKYGKYYK